MNERLYLKKAIFSTVVFILILTDCSGKRNDAEKPNHEGIGESGTEAYSESTEAVTEPSSGDLLSEPKLTEADWSEYFNGLNGAAVLYDASAMHLER